RYAWDFLTETLALPAERLLVTVYETDDEAYTHWRDDIGLPEDRILRIGDTPEGDSDNFWQMGDTGPCGPSSEIFYDHGEHIPGGPPGSPDEDGDRFIEIWNIVFMQYDRAADGTLSDLPRPSVDTGMGLERLSAVLQGVHSNYQIDLFRHLIDAAVKVTGAADRESSSLKVIADHIRSCAFLIVDGVRPGNEGRDYVLRRIIRRAARHGHKLGQHRPFFHKLVQPLVKEMGEAYPELAETSDEISRVLLAEEERFLETLASGMQLLEQVVAGLPKGGTIDGKTAFGLYDTHGFPLDLTADIARERGLAVDQAGFEREMAERRAQSRAASHFTAETIQFELEEPTVFEGHEQELLRAQVIAVAREGSQVQALDSGQDGVIVLDRTPFYAESGGQVGDTGVIESASGRFVVYGTQKQGSLFLHHGTLTDGHMTAGEVVTARIDADRRAAIRLNHSATHLLHAALRQVLGDHIQQKGSRVAPEALRFDFSHDQPVTREQLLEVERLVNAQIRENQAVETREMALDDAREAGAMALFGEKYGDTVRVVTMGPFSMELCGGTHARRGGDIGLFKILSESGVASGVRRIEAVTGATALAEAERSDQTVTEIAELLRGPRTEAAERVAQMLERSRQLERELAQLKAKLASASGDELADRAETIGSAKLLVAELPGVDAGGLRESLDKLRDKLGTAAILLGTVDEGKVRLVAGLSKDLTKTLKAGEWVNIAAAEVGGKGGGRPDMAQAGGSQPERLAEALAAARHWAADKLG
ncbi:MAG TPA: alanine--tRNA ligase, partial [Guyparkeria sp.]|nr:alanine--tRNA ligase [Guyparkeria sp.]